MAYLIKKVAKKGVFVDWRFAVLVLVILLLASNGFWLWKDRERMRVERVIDGDTLVIKTGDRVRLVGLDAPETGKCGASESKQKLEELVSSKIIRIDRDERDSWGRRLGMVFVGGVNVSLEMVRSGWARFDNFTGGGSEEMRQAGQGAEDAGLGIYGSECTGDKEKCDILGNIDQSTGKKYYHLPGCYSYGKVRISAERGEQVFCSEMEAKSAGFELVPDCVR